MAQIWVPNNPDLAADVLEDNGYVDGSITSWNAPEWTAVVQLLRFEDARSAVGFQETYEGFIDGYPGFDRVEDLPGIEGGSITVVGLDGGESAYAVAAKGAIVVRIMVVASEAVDLGALGTLAEQQYALLP